MGDIVSLPTISDDGTRRELRQTTRTSKKLLLCAAASFMALIITLSAVMGVNGAEILECRPEGTPERTYTCMLSRNRIGVNHSRRIFTNVEGLSIHSSGVSLMEFADQDTMLDIDLPADIASQFSRARRESQPLLISLRALNPILLGIGSLALPFWYLALRALWLQGSWAVFDSAQGTVTYRSEGLFKAKIATVRFEDIREIVLGSQQETRMNRRVISERVSIHMYLNDKPLPITLGTAYGLPHSRIPIRETARKLLEQINTWWRPKRAKPTRATPSYIYDGPWDLNEE